MKDLAKIVVVSACVSCCVVIGGNFGMNTVANKIETLERRIADIEIENESKCELIFNMVGRIIDIQRKLQDGGVK